MPEEKAYLAAIAISGLRLIGCIMGTVALRFIDRKFVLISSCILMSISILIFGLNLNFGESLHLGRYSTAFPLGLFCLYMVSFGFGAGTIPWTMLGGLVPAKVKPAFDLFMLLLIKHTKQIT